MLLGVVPTAYRSSFVYMFLISFSADEIRMLARYLHMMSVADFGIQMPGIGLLIHFLRCWKSEFLVAIKSCRQLWLAARVVCDMNEFAK